MELKVFECSRTSQDLESVLTEPKNRMANLPSSDSKGLHHHPVYVCAIDACTRLDRSSTAFVEYPESTKRSSDLAPLFTKGGERLHHLCRQVGSRLGGAAGVEAVAGCCGISAPSAIDERGQRAFVDLGSNGSVFVGLVTVDKGTGRV